MTRGRDFSRRNFLRGLGGVSLALPLFSSLGCQPESPRRAAENLGRAMGPAGFPKRFVVVYTPNGNYTLPPTMDFAGSQLEPLTPFKDKLLVLNGLDLATADLPPGEPHQTGMAFLTGRNLNPGNMVGSDGQKAGWASGPSVDQEIAAAIGQDTPHKSLHFGVQSTAYGGTEVRTVISYAGSDEPISNEDSPYNMFDLLFSSFGQDTSDIVKLRARRHSVLDAVGKQYEKLTPKLSAEENRLKLEQHLTSIRDVESRLDKPVPMQGGSCQTPILGAQIDLKDASNFAVIGQLQMDLLAMALACNMTRVATLQWSAAPNNRPFPFLTYDDGSGNGPMPITDDDHGMGHQPDSSIHVWGKLAVIRRWYIEQFAYLLSKLDSIPEGTGTMLDNTVVILGSELSRGNSHSHANVPFLLAGSGGGYFKMGRYLNYAEVPHNNLLVALLNAMGIQATTFGDPAFCNKPITNLTSV